MWYIVRLDSRQSEECDSSFEWRPDSSQVQLYTSKNYDFTANRSLPLFYWTISDWFWGQWIVNTDNWYVLFSHYSDFPPCWEQFWDKSIAHGFFHYLEVCVRWSVKKCIMYGFPRDGFLTTRHRFPSSSHATRVGFGDSWWENCISHGTPYKMPIARYESWLVFRRFMCLLETHRRHTISHEDSINRVLNVSSIVWVCGVWSEAGCFLGYSHGIIR